MVYYLPLRGISAAGSAQHWQCWGQEFESPMLHQEEPPEMAVFSCSLLCRHKMFCGK